MKQTTADKLRLLLQLIFQQQASQAALLVKPDAPLPDMEWMVTSTAEAVKPLVAELYRQGMVQAAARMAAKLGRRGSVRMPRAEEPRRVEVGNDAVFGNSTVIPLEQQPSYNFGPNITLFKSARGRVVCKAAPDVGFDFDLFNPRVLRAVDALTMAFCQDTFQTAQLAVRDAQEATRQLLRDGLPKGAAVELLAREVRTIFADPKRAFTIAATEGARAIHGGQMTAAQEAGVERHSWLASADACEHCLKLDGKSVKLGEPFWVNPKGGPYAVVLHPPLHPHCVLPDTHVIVPGMLHSTRSSFSGTCYRITLADGNEFACTPNHMLLSGLGFVRASDIVQGDHIICRSGSQRVDGRYPNDDRQPSRAEDIFDASAIAFGMPTAGVPVSPEYLHGDAAFCQGNIDVVETDSFLLNRNQCGSDFRQHGDETILEHADVLAARRFLLDRCGVSEFGRFLGRLSSLCVMRGTRHRQASFIAENRVRIGVLPGRDSLLTKPLENGVASASVFGGQLVGSCTRQVFSHDFFHREITLVKVSHVRPFWYSGFVYDFQTASSLYHINNGIISSNCFCTTAEEI